jgi:hypothetical protein
MGGDVKVYPYGSPETQHADLPLILVILDCRRGCNLIAWGISPNPFEFEVAALITPVH